MSIAIPPIDTRIVRTAMPYRPASMIDLPMIHARLMQAIDNSPFYNADFKAFEKSRCSKPFLAALIDADPEYILIALYEEQAAGFVITSPEYGTLFLHWAHIFPEFQHLPLATQAAHTLISHWNNNRFHKISAYINHRNRAAIALATRVGFIHRLTLERHIFGEDYLFFEYGLTKSIAGYDMGISRTPQATIRRRLRQVFRF